MPSVTISDITFQRVKKYALGGVSPDSYVHLPSMHKYVVEVDLATFSNIQREQAESGCTPDEAINNLINRLEAYAKGEIE